MRPYEYKLYKVLICFVDDSRMKEVIELLLKVHKNKLVVEQQAVVKLSSTILTRVLDDMDERFRLLVIYVLKFTRYVVKLQS